MQKKGQKIVIKNQKLHFISQNCNKTKNSYTINTNEERKIVTDRISRELKKLLQNSGVCGRPYIISFYKNSALTLSDLLSSCHITHHNCLLNPKKVKDWERNGEFDTK